MKLVFCDSYGEVVFKGNKHSPALAATTGNRLGIDTFAFANPQMRTQESEHSPHRIGKGKESCHVQHASTSLGGIAW